eukprot:scaffold96078_cov40-Tisochrysis_lutea.AAC.2
MCSSFIPSYEIPRGGTLEPLQERISHLSLQEGRVLLCELRGKAETAPSAVGGEGAQASVQ